MNPIKRNGQYFINDNEITKSKNDKFQHNDIAENIVNVIQNKKAPFNIAIVGKWGLGKSSLINMVKSHFVGLTKEYIVEDINAWKYEKEALKRVLLRKTLAHLNYSDDRLKKMLEGLSVFTGKVEDIPIGFKKWFKTEFFPFATHLVLISSLYILFLFISKLLNSINALQPNESIKFIEVISDSLNDFSSKIYLPVVIELFLKYIKSSSGKHNFSINAPITSTDEYERILEEKLNNNEYKDKKIIIIFDDLDRLTPNKVVEALDAIKAFVGYPNFIFIVPFDDKILRDAIKQEKTQLNCNEHLTIESDLFLDKLFQFKVFLPNIIQADLPNYAIDIANTEASDLVELIGHDEFMKICKGILIHKKVTTPRQVKKILNTFSGNVLLGYRREQSGVDKGVFTSINGVNMLAKISVLQADFPDFYSSLFIDSNLIKKLLELYKEINNDNYRNINNPEFLRNYFNNEKLTTTGESLCMFLERTAHINCENISRYLYLNDDNISLLFGNKLSMDIRDGLTSGTYNLVREAIYKSEKENTDNLLYEILNTVDDEGDIINYCIGIVSLIDLIDYGSKLVSLVNEKLEAIYALNESLDTSRLVFKNAMSLYVDNPNFSGIDRLMINHLKNKPVDLLDSINIFFVNEKNTSDSLKKYINEIIKTIYTIDESYISVLELFELKNLEIDKHFDDYLSSVDLFKSITSYLCDEGLFEEKELIEKYKEIFIKHIKSGSNNNILKSILEYLDNIQLQSILLDIIVNYTDKFTQLDINGDVCFKLINTQNEELYDKINKVLSSIDWSTTDDYTEVLDNYISKNLNSQYIENILSKVALKNKIDIIPKSIDLLIGDILDTEIGTNLISQIEKQFNDNQNSKLTSVMQNPFSYNSNDENKLDRAISIILALVENENFENIIESISNHIYNQVTSYNNNMLEKIKKLYDLVDYIPSSIKTNFINWSLTNIQNYSKVSISIMHIFLADIKNEMYPDVAKKNMDNTTEDSLELSLKILREVRTSFNKENGMTSYYLQFLIRNIDVSSCRKSILSDILNYYVMIYSLKEIIVNAIVYEDSFELLNNITNKFIVKLDKNGKINLLKNILNELQIEYIKDINILFGHWNKTEFKELIVICINDASPSDSVKYIYNLIKLSGLNEIEQKLIIKIITLFLDMCDDSLVSDSLDIINNIGKIQTHAEKMLFGDSLYKLFKNTDVEEYKNKIFEVAKNCGVNSSFIKDSKNELRDFTDDELIIVKQKRMRKATAEA